MLERASVCAGPDNCRLDAVWLREPGIGGRSSRSAAGQMGAGRSGTNLGMTASLALVVSAAASANGSSGPSASVWVSTAALLISFMALSTSFFRDRRLLLQQVQESLTTIDQQRGRRAIHQMAKEGKAVADLTDLERAQCNNSLAALNTMAIYYDRNWVSQDALLQLWAEPVVKLMAAARPLLESRDAEHLGGRIWPDLRKFEAAARAYARARGWDVTYPAPAVDGTSGAPGQP